MKALRQHLICAHEYICLRGKNLGKKRQHEIEMEKYIGLS